MKFIGLCSIWLLIMLAGTGCAQRKFDMIELKCNTCHASSYIYQKNRTIQDWDRVVFGMKSAGLVLTEQEEAAIKNILYTHFRAE